MSSVVSCNMCDGDRLIIEEVILYCMECAGEQSSWCARCHGCGCVRQTIAHCITCERREVREEQIVQKKRLDWT